MISKEEYLKAQKVVSDYQEQERPKRKYRCCGRCTREDTCVSDMECEIDGHETYGCEICFGPRFVDC